MTNLEIEAQEETIQEPVRSDGWTGWDVLWISLCALLILAVGIVAWIVVIRLTQGSADPFSQPSLVSSILLGFLEVIALLGSVYMLGIRRKRLSWSAAGFRPLSLEWLVISVGLSVIAIPLGGLVAVLVQLLLGQPVENPQLDFIIPDGFTIQALLGMLLIGGMLVPLAEEALFRGVFYSWLRRRLNFPIALVISSLVFGAVHGEPAVGTAAFVLGLMLAWSFEKSGSLWAPVIIHVVNNAVKIVFIYLLFALGLDKLL